MEEVMISDKQKYLNENFPFEDVPEVMDKKLCLHCNQVFYVGHYKVFKNASGFELICCPNAPACDGTAIDWLPEDFSFE